MFAIWWEGVITSLLVYLIYLIHRLLSSFEKQNPKHGSLVSSSSSTTTPSKTKSASEQKQETTTTTGAVAAATTPPPPAPPATSTTPSTTSSKYRMNEEKARNTASSEYTRRGQLWSKHASWHLPSATRTQQQQRYRRRNGIEHVVEILRKYDVDLNRGFLPSEDPLQRLPYARYHLWEDIGDDLPKLLGVRLGQARDPLRQLPVLNTDKLITNGELRRAHLLLSLFAHAYVWGGQVPMDHIPEGIARPLVEVSAKLGIPPVLGHPSIVLYNWRRLDVYGDINMENIATLNNFFDGRDESWFYLITVEIEARGAAAIVPLMLTMDAIQRFREEKALQLLDNNNNNGSATNSSKHGGNNNNNSGNNNNNNMILKPLKKYSSHDYSNDPIVMMRPHARSHSLSADMLQVNNNNNSSKQQKDKQQQQGEEHENLKTKESSNPSMDQQQQQRVPMYSYDEQDDENQTAELEQALIGELTPDRIAKYIVHQLIIVAEAIGGMAESMESMREGCHPFIFFHRVRPFLSGWKDNPVLPHGVKYIGVPDNNNNNEDAIWQFYGGSAAQSALLPFLDIAFGISHNNIKSNAFLLAMREYMIKSHREFLDYFQTIASLRDFIMEFMPADKILDVATGKIGNKVDGNSTATTTATTTAATTTTAVDPEDILFTPTAGNLPSSTHPHTTMNRTQWELLCNGYNTCIDNLQHFRSVHINIVAEYILAQQKQSRQHQHDSTIQDSAGGKGTGGTEIMSFLKPIRDNVKRNMIVDEGQQQQQQLQSQQDGDEGETTTTTTTTTTAITESKEDVVGALPLSVAKDGKTAAGSTATLYRKDNASSEDITADLYPPSKLRRNNNILRNSTI